MKILKKLLSGILAVSIIMPMFVYAAPPDMPPGEAPSGMPGGSSSSSISYKGANIISEDKTINDKSYSSTTGSENALLVSGGTSTINSCTINKTGDSSGDDSDFYGTNAGILVYNGGKLNINGGTITTNGAHANAVFAYGTGIINISDATIKTTNNNSGAIMVTGGGTLNANNVTATTDGNSSAPIRSDRGGGTLNVTGGSFTSNGTGSPAIYSTAEINVNGSKLTSTSSEGIVIEGKNSVTLNDVTLDATNNTLNGNSETYKAIFIYQSMSGDADVGTSTFTSNGSKIINNKGDIFFITNTTTVISLENNTIVNNDSDGAFLRASSAKWGTSGSNGGDVTLNLTNQKVSGDIVIDSISTLKMTMKSGSIFIGSIDKSNEAKNVTLSLSKDSVISLSKDTYLDSLENEDSTNSNIYSNGKYKLYVDGKEVSINNSTYEETNSDIVTSTTGTNNYTMYYIIGGAAVILLAGAAILIIKSKKNKNI